MNWYKESKKKCSDEFDYGDSIRTLWNNIIKMEQDRSNIHFDLENNDCYDLKTKDLTYKRDDTEYRVRANLCWAGGDWENPIAYFRCQFESRSYLDNEVHKGWYDWKPCCKTIIIPIKSNLNLIKGKNGGMIASQDGEGVKSKKDEIKDKDLWDDMVELASKRIKEFNTQEMSYGGDARFKNTGCERDLASLMRKK